MKKLFNKLFPITFEIYEHLGYYKVYEYRQNIKFVTVTSSYWRNSLSEATDYISARRLILAQCGPKIVHKEVMQ